MMLVVWRTESGPRVSRARSDSPGMKGMRKYGSAPTSPARSTGRVVGGVRGATVMISRRNRSTDTAAARSGDRTLTTTSRASVVSRARKTRDMPPPPSSRPITNSGPSGAPPRRHAPPQPPAPELPPDHDLRPQLRLQPLGQSGFVLRHLLRPQGHDRVGPGGGARRGERGRG